MSDTVIANNELHIRSGAMDSAPKKVTATARGGSSPPQTPNVGVNGLLISGLNSMAVSTITDCLTPPLTPSHSATTSPSHGSTSSPTSKSMSFVTPIQEILMYSSDLEFALDSSGRRVEYGRGAWSNVYRAKPRQFVPVKHSNSVPTPPSTPETPSLVVAVKSPSHRQAQAILHHEARILTHLCRITDSPSFITPFHGFIPSTSSLVLSAIPLTLANHVTNLASRPPPPKFSPTEPILGNITWLGLCHHLIGALHWLHATAYTIHGDIKPHNILLQPTSPSVVSSVPLPYFPYHPLLVDFSSSHSTSIDPSSTPSGALSALTCEYTAPELLTSAVLSDPSSLPTLASDVFSLGVTLTSAATGNVAIYSGPGYVKNAKARQGWEILEFLRSEKGGLRMERGGIVEGVVAPAVRKVEGRIGVLEWKRQVEAILGEGGGNDSQ